MLLSRRTVEPSRRVIYVMAGLDLQAELVWRAFLSDAATHGWFVARSAVLNNDGTSTAL
jgi:hypothetical protein